jgi:hypothetical protein
MLEHLSRWARDSPGLVSMPADGAVDPETGKALRMVVFTEGEGAAANRTTSIATDTVASLPLNQRARTLITCGIHARELITVDACFALLRLLASPDDADTLALLAWPEMRTALSTSGIISTQAAASASRALPAVRAAARRLAASTELRVIPVVNPDSRATIETRGNYALRVNGRGVDLNRNMPSNWKPPVPGQRPGDDTYPGPTPSSEWETRAVGAAMMAGVDSFLDLHSGFVSLMGPSPSSACGLQRAMTRESARAHERAMRAMQRSMLSPSVAGPTARVLYPAAGTTMDDAFVRAKARVAMAVEIYDSQFSTRAGYTCPTYPEFWEAPCRSEPGGNEAAGVACRPIAGRGAGGREAEAEVPLVPDGELMWHEIKDVQKMAELMERYGVSEGARLPGGGGGGELGEDDEAAATTTAREAWWADDVVLQHAAKGGRGTVGYLTTFNPTEPDEFRRVVSAWVAALWAFAVDAERQ